MLNINQLSGFGGKAVKNSPALQCHGLEIGGIDFNYTYQVLTSDDSIILYSKSNTKFVVVKISSDGSTVLWKKEIVTSIGMYGLHYNATTDRVYLCLSWGASGYYGLLSLNCSDGSTAVQTYVTGFGTYGDVTCIHTTEDSIYLGGRRYSGGNYYPTVVRLDLSGNVIASTYFTNPLNGYVMGIVSGDSGNIVIQLDRTHLALVVLSRDLSTVIFANTYRYGTDSITYASYVNTGTYVITFGGHIYASVDAAGGTWVIKIDLITGLPVWSKLIASPSCIGLTYDKSNHRVIVSVGNSSTSSLITLSAADGELVHKYRINSGFSVPECANRRVFIAKTDYFSSYYHPALLIVPTDGTLIGTDYNNTKFHWYLIASTITSSDRSPATVAAFSPTPTAFTATLSVLVLTINNLTATSSKFFVP